MNKGDESDSAVLSSDERSTFINKSAMDKNALKKALASTCIVGVFSRMCRCGGR